MRFLFVLIFGVLASFPGKSASAQEPAPTARVVTLCELLKVPQSYDGMNLQIRGVVSSEFEVFTIYEPACQAPSIPGIWLMFGGDVNCPTPSTWNDVGRPKGKNVKFKGAEYSLVKDDVFHEFYKGVTTRKQRKAMYSVTATLEGTFFSGDIMKNGLGLPGYGHLGCCHLFIIHPVIRSDSKKIIA